ncbi:MAG: TetR/AcrR family transcriptional regulator [Actinobacteria bacterium]|nr:TetR/AcrR family transcriptional regulator [Actinomycetota bacterium]
MSSAVINLTAEDQEAGSHHEPASAATRPPAGRKPGRPRSEKAEQAIIEATLALFAEKGPDGLCVEAVAARAGVGKATVYRRWKNKEDLLLAALGSLKSPLPDPDTGSVRADLVALVAVMARDGVDPARQRQYTLLLGEGAKYPKLMARYADTVVEPRREVIRAVLRRGIETGQLRPDLDIEIILLTLTGAAMSRGRCEIVPHDGEFAERVVDSLLLGLAPR